MSVSSRSELGGLPAAFRTWLGGGGGGGGGTAHDSGSSSGQAHIDDSTHPIVQAREGERRLADELDCNSFFAVEVAAGRAGVG